MVLPVIPSHKLRELFGQACATGRKSLLRLRKLHGCHQFQQSAISIVLVFKVTTKFVQERELVWHTDQDDRFHIKVSNRKDILV